MKVVRHFSLVELLIVCSIIMILAALLVPALNQARSNAKSTICLNNQRQILMILQMYGMDHNEIPIKYWSKALLETQYVPPSDNVSLFCPTWYPPNELGNHHQTYGMRQIEEEVHSFVNVQTPSTHVLIADSIRLNPDDPLDGMKQYFRFYGNTGQHMNRVHCRHQRKANVGFMDGHVESCSGQELENFGCPKYAY